MAEPSVINIGGGRWEPALHGPWVSKTDVIQLGRCPYRVFLTHKHTVPYGQFMEPVFRERLLARGISAEAEVIIREEVREEVSAEAARSEEGIVRIPALFRNHDLGIIGVLDMVIVKNGRLIPVEVKSRRQLQQSDELELAFYWRLLEPIQKGRRDRNREGYVWLSPNPPKDTDGRREDSGRGWVRELQGRWPGGSWGRWGAGGRSSGAAQGP